MTMTIDDDGAILVHLTNPGGIVGGSGVANQIAYWTDTDTIGGDPGLTYDAATDTITIAGNILMADDKFIGITGDIRIEFDPTDGDIMFHLGDAAGSDEVQVLDSGSNVMVYLDSDGNAEFKGHVGIGETAAALGNELLNLEGDIAASGSAFKLNPRIAAGGVTCNALYSRVRVAPAVAGVTVVAVSIGNVSLGAGATLGTQQGIYINPLTAATSNWAIYVAPSTRSYFGGDVGIGITGPNRELEVYGDANGIVGVDIVNVNTGANAITGLRVKQDSGATGANSLNIETYSTGYTTSGLHYQDGAFLGTGGGLLGGLSISTDGNAPLRFGTQNQERARILGNGKVGIGVTAPLAQLHVDQNSGSGAIPVLYLDQADVSEEMIEFATTIGAGNAIEAVGGKTLTTTHFIKVTLPGALTRYIPVGTIA